MRRALLSLSVLLAILCAPFAAAEEEARVETALALTKRAAKLLQAEGESLDKYLERFGAEAGGEDRAAGFGGRRMKLTRWGGALTATIHVAAHDGIVVATEVHLVGTRDDWKAAREQLVAAAGEAFEVDERGLHASWTSAKGLARWRTKIEESLGKVADAAVPAELAAHVAVLQSPTRFYHVGASFGFAGIVPEGRAAAEELTKAERFDLLRAALRSPNPEGRVEAARAIVIAARGDMELTAADRRAIDHIRAAVVPIQKCEGCVVGDARAGELVPKE